MNEPELTQEYLMSVLSYDKESGNFTWISDRYRQKLKGKKAGTIDCFGYIHITINKKMYRGHRLAWLYIYGKWPKHQIDHINEVKSDNRICNLRELTHAQNQQNITSATKRNSSGLRGVSWCKNMKKWKSRITANGKQIFIGYFDEKEHAYISYLNAKKQLHPYSRT